MAGARGTAIAQWEGTWLIAIDWDAIIDGFEHRWGTDEVGNSLILVSKSDALSLRGCVGITATPPKAAVAPATRAPKLD
jgi:hypothetical protein